MRQAGAIQERERQQHSGMRLKTFHATTIQGAIEQARRDFGPDAMLLNSRKTGQNDEGLAIYSVTFGYSERQAEGESSERVIPAPAPGPPAENANARMLSVPGAHAAGAGSPQTSPKMAPAERVRETGRRQRSTHPLEESEPFGGASRHGQNTDDCPHARATASLDASQATGKSPGQDAHSYEKLLAQMASMRSEVMHLAGSVRRASGMAIRQGLADESARHVFDLLVSQDFDLDFVEHVMQDVGAQHPHPGASHRAQPGKKGLAGRSARRRSMDGQEVLLDAVRELIGSRIELASEPTLRRNRTKPRVIALVGPPGVGKTTSLVKLAARFASAGRFGMQVLSLDNYRVAATEQLQIYAAILGVGFEALSSPTSLPRAMQSYGSKDIILIDTPGYGWKDFGAARDQAQALGDLDDATIHLVLSASMKASDLSRVADLYEIFRYNALLFTRLDETLTVGPVISEAWRRGKEISYLCGGQRVPEDIEPASRERLVQRIFSNTVVADESAA